ncbi:MAG: DNA/RNA nuclease SfsA [Oscillospiraceae bacterium]|nr:DNA/RNA nuclease SfsA [Oscillospiraceae bacterium]
MKYSNIIKGKFKSRPNRFIAVVEIDGADEICHVKNTGRCKELLTENAVVYLSISDNPNRKTKYDLIAVEKGDLLINMDSQIVNHVCIEYLPKMFKDIVTIKPEYKYGNSRFDIFVETKSEKILIECKGVTLEEDGTALFPDAPTERGVKHLNELQKAVTEGYRAFAVFVIQMNGVKCFMPNKKTHPQFADALKKVAENGVNILAYDCNVTPNSISIDKTIPICL